MAIVTFKDVLQAKLDTLRAMQHHYGPTIEKLLERWLAREADSQLWGEIAEAHETTRRSREKSFRSIISAACDALNASDPKHGYIASPLGAAAIRRQIEQYDELAGMLDKLALERRDHNTDRARMYEEEAKRFRLNVSELKTMSAQLGRQARSQRGGNGNRQAYAHARSRRIFVLHVTEHMRAVFGKPYHRAVAIMTDLAYPSNKTTTSEEIAKIWSRRKT
jgi:hypothetical protein